MKRLSLLVGALSCGAVSCGGGGAIVFGVTSDYPAGADLNRLDGNLAAGGTLSEPAIALGTGPGQSTFPLEIPVDSVNDGASVSLRLQGFQNPNLLIVDRFATTQAVGGERLLYRVRLEERCHLQIGGSGGIAPCPDGQTCVDGRCVDPFVPPGALEPYDPSWMQDVGDTCKPPDATAPDVEIGQGKDDYATLADGAIAQVNAGPQGGYHVFVALRLHNLRRYGSVAELSGALADLPRVALAPNKPYPDTTLIPDEGGWCKLSGLPLVLACCGQSADAAIKVMLGHELVITAKVTDKDGSVANAQKSVQLSSDILLTDGQHGSL